jgi:hypothetical protein
MTGRARRRCEAPRLRLGTLFSGFLACLTASGCASSPAPPAESARAPASDPPLFTSGPASEPEAHEAKSDPTTARTFGWLSIAVGTEAAIVATATSVMMLEDRSTRSSDCNSAKVCSSAGFNANTQLSAVAGWNAGAFVLAAAGLGLGTYLILSHPIERHTEVYVSPAGVALGGNF